MSEDIDRGSILVAVDGSAHADRAAGWAAEQALLDQHPLVVVTVDDRATEVADVVASRLRRAHPLLGARSLTVPGDPRHALLELSSNADLLVVGSRGRGALKSLLLGSVSAAVSAGATCPVVVCRPRSGGGPQRGVLVGADGTTESVPVIEFAYRQAALWNMPLTVLHCFWDAVAAVAQYRETRGEVVEAPDLEDLRATVSESLVGLAEQYPDVPVTVTLKHGLVDEALGSPQDGWDLVVVGRHPMTTLSRVLTGSIATTVVERAHTTVAVVPEAPRSA
jgi:nucleotide-binding universal stress UspA family protein